MDESENGFFFNEWHEKGQIYTIIARHKWKRTDFNIQP